MILSELLGKTELEYEISGNKAAEVTSIAYDSRKATSGSFFFCLTGAKSDGHSYAMGAYDSGCRIFAVERRLELPQDCVQVLFENTRMALAYISAAFYDFPARKLKIIGITGTKGKTTIANMILHCLESCNIKTGYIGTSGIDYAGLHFETKNTTPESLELHNTFSDMLKEKVTTVVIEVSSQALFNYRVDGIPFYIGIFTNLSPDHIGEFEHPTFEHYKNCKKKLFSLCRHGIFNIDDEYFPDMTKDCSCSVTSYGKSTAADFCGRNIQKWSSDGKLGISFDVELDGKTEHIKLPMPGEFSVLNALCAIAASKMLTDDIDSIISALENTLVKGRFQLVPIFNDRIFVIDYAHNEVSLKTLLESVREYNPKRIVCLFGSVGDRTKGRRRELGYVASRLADFSIITSDNPGNENPEAIIDEIASYFDDDTKYIKIPDREQAIRYVVRNSRAGDIVLLCGKGHENYQLIRGENVPFSEYDILMSEKCKN